MVIHYLFQGLATLVTNEQSLIFLIAGSLIGLIVGVIPGLGGPVIMSIVVAFAFRLTIPEVASLFLAVLAGSYYSASITSILLNTPAHPEAFAVTFDGFPMAQRGEAGRALGISASSTLIGGLIGCALLVVLLQFINQLSVAFHPPEYVALIALALILVSTLGTNSTSKALTSAGLGIVFASVGESYITGAERYTFNSIGLLGGINLIALVLGMLAIPQMILLFGTATKVARQDMMGRTVSNATPAEIGRDYRRQSIQGVKESFRHLISVIRSALIGVITGIIPGIGGFAANFLSYSIAEQVTKKKSGQFGKGIAEGIIAAEGSSLAKEAGGLIPLLGLGIPGGVGSALFLAVLALKNVDPGYGFVKHYPVLTYEMVWIIAIGGLIGTVGGLILTPGLAQITRVPGICIVPLVMTLVVIGVFAAEGSMFTVGEMAIFMIVGFVLRRLRYSLPAIVIGLVLGTTFESNVYLTTKVFPGFSFVWRQPFADVLLLLAIATLVWKATELRRASRSKNTETGPSPIAQPLPTSVTAGPMQGEVSSNQGDYDLAPGEIGTDPQQGETSSSQHQERTGADYPLLSAVTSGLLFALGLFVLIYGLLKYDKATVLMPAIGGIAVAVSSAWRFPTDLSKYVRFRRSFKLDKFELGEVTDSRVTFSGRPAATLGTMARFRKVIFPRLQRDNTMVDERFPEIKEGSWGFHGQYSREFLGFLWFVGLIAVCYIFGFLIGIVSFLLIFGITATGRVFNSWIGRVVFAVSSAVVMGIVSNLILVSFLHLAYIPIIQF